MPGFSEFDKGQTDNRRAGSQRFTAAALGSSALTKLAREQLRTCGSGMYVGSEGLHRWCAPTNELLMEKSQTSQGGRMEADSCPPLAAPAMGTGASQLGHGALQEGGPAWGGSLSRAFQSFTFISAASPCSPSTPTHSALPLLSYTP